ncbi:uncharacterized protein [Triticum aestivum]|uniref:uncharacterized protein isoform X1 n=1 Tax=Triticum aestivum TaxID=4565 RepID=UPI001D021E21|nr:uncharacterized protein LOC123159203 isoform X1 [Triticum aestivum]XP_044432964.1 uncharacterized protein LOC123159203 isoform X1 [Triticum aestivum]XP_044432965.1 uncharacterized protein LOC123159203 isoform X1 [Triticum aestivum]XP_044432966.1 uncharacterized protein LOC123159203 isoform X1 [Triticum aestivum]XP_044432967.1 uncharacterized protein LOC123159203 isoform X1 [Triticum aestivum]
MLTGTLMAASTPTSPSPMGRPVQRTPSPGFTSVQYPPYTYSPPDYAASLTPPVRRGLYSQASSSSHLGGADATEADMKDIIAAGSAAAGASPGFATQDLADMDDELDYGEEEPEEEEEEEEEPAPTRKIKNNKKKKAAKPGEPRIKWASKEEECLAVAWKVVCLDPATGTNQIIETYWDHIKAEFDERKLIDPYFKGMHMKFEGYVEPLVAHPNGVQQMAWDSRGSRGSPGERHQRRGSGIARRSCCCLSPHARSFRLMRALGLFWRALWCRRLTFFLGAAAAHVCHVPRRQQRRRLQVPPRLQADRQVREMGGRSAHPRQGQRDVQAGRADSGRDRWTPGRQQRCQEGEIRRDSCRARARVHRALHRRRKNQGRRAGGENRGEVGSFDDEQRRQTRLAPRQRRRETQSPRRQEEKQRPRLLDGRR